MLETAVILVVFILGGVGLYLFATPRRQKWHAMNATQLWPIADAPHDALVRVKGKVRPVTETLIAPLSGTPCVYYAVSVSTVRQIGRHTKARILLASEKKACEFAVVDATGTAIVEPDAAKMALNGRAESSGAIFDKTTDRQRAFALRHGVSNTDTSNMLYLEQIIAVDAPIVVRAIAMRETDPGARASDAYRATAPTRVRFLKSAKYPIELTNDKAALAAK